MSNHRKKMVDFSFRYMVMGIYKDRNNQIIRIYPLPFMRITVRIK